MTPWTWRPLGGDVAIPDSEGIHEWLFDEGSGSNADDRVGSADLSLNGPSWESGAGIGDYYLSFDGENDDAVADGGDLTDWTDSGGMILPVVPVDGNGENMLWFHQTNGDRFYFDIRNDDNDVRVALAESIDEYTDIYDDINTDSWNAFAVFWDSGSYDVHVYDISNETLTSNTDNSYSGTMEQNGDLTVGSSGGGAYADMGADFPKIFDKYLSPSEVEDRIEEIAWAYE